MPADRTRKVFSCQDCGYESPKWMGFCPSCGRHTPLVEAPPFHRTLSKSRLATTPAEPQELFHVSHEQQDRIPMGFAELDRVLGGGIVPGSVLLIAGEPGIGKSTLLLQIAGFLASAGGRVLYVSGEESAHQIKLRSDRLGFSGEGIFLLAETDADEVVRQLEHLHPALAVVDSIQTMYAQEVNSGPGTVAQVRECALRLISWAKTRDVPVLIAGHVTKDGTLAGPRALEHLVDVVLYLEGENLNAYRILRGVKNRFGSTNEVGIFQMGSSGLEEVPDPSRAMLSQHRDGAVGSSIVSVLEGSRPLLVEVQALTSPSTLSVPRRIANGVDYNRLLMLAAVLSRRVGLNLSNQDIIVNVVGGLKAREPAADAAVALAIASSTRNVPLVPGTVALAEVGLSGELRTVPQLQRRLDEVHRLGFRRCLIPASALVDVREVEGVETVFAETLAQALQQCVPRRKDGRAARPVVEVAAE